MTQPVPPGMEAQPHPHHPNLRQETGLYCFKDATRACGAECMAYIAPPAGDDYKDQQWAHCMELVSMHRTGKHLVVIAANLDQLIRLRKKADADRERLNQPAVPKVT